MPSGSFIAASLGSSAHLSRTLIAPVPQQRQSRQRQLHVVAVQKEDPSSSSSSSSDPSQPGATPRRRRRRNRTPKDLPPEVFSLDDLNPVSMGRKSRMIFDDVWAQLQRIGGPSRSVAVENLPFQLDAPEAYESPRASETTVLVTGATGRVGRVLVRKLLLRGYTVRALVRRRGGSTDDAALTESIPRSVQVVFGDVGDYKACRAAVDGVDKVICCSAARTTLTADLNRVDDTGVSNLARAFLDARNAAARRTGAVAPSTKIDVADFEKESYHPLWDVEHVGPPDQDLAKTGYFAQSRRRNVERARDSAEAFIDEDDALIFEGAVYSRDGYAQVGAPLHELPHGATLGGTEGLLIRLKGDAHQYTAVVETTDGKAYGTTFLTRTGYSTVRLPWSMFAPGRGVEDDSMLIPSEVQHLSFRFDPKTKTFDQVTQAGQSMYDNTANRFRLAVDWIKALPGGEETDFVLVSCAGARRAGQDETEREKIIGAKRRGEAALRNSGLGYTIVRPGPLAEEAGGYKALVFDQGNRITENVACADVADICLKALHDDSARNKTFEVCWEYTPEEGLESWDLLCHFPDKSTGYLTQALSPLQKNT